jgi:hypothetical protein
MIGLILSQIKTCFAFNFEYLRVGTLESEIRLCVAASQQAEAAHAEELAKARETIVVKQS